MLSTLGVATNPDHTFPLLPELALIGSLSLCILSCATDRLKIDWFEIGLILALIVNSLGIILPRLVLHVLASPGQQWIPCLAAGKSFYSIECFVQSAVGGHSGVRTFYMLSTAIFVGLGCFCLVRLRPSLWRYFSAVIVGLAVLHSLVAFFGKFSDSTELLPTWIVVPTMGLERLTAVFSNPGWVWPYYLPSLVITLWGSIYAKRTWIRLGSLSLLLLLSLTCVFTLQRGALLLVGILWGLGIIVALTRRVQNTKVFLVLSIALAGIAAAGLYVVRQQLDQGLMTSLQSGKSLISSSNERIAIWKAAWEMFKEHPLLGHGYATWYAEIVSFRDQFPQVPVFDTAHNLFVQILVELGLLHGVLIFAIFIGLGFLLLRKSRDLTGRGFLGFALIVGGLMCTLVQELDYIRPTFYTFAVMVGSAVGLRPVPTPSFERVLTCLRSLAWVGCVIAGLGLAFVHYYFATGMFGFEADLRVKSDHVERWGSESVILPTFATDRDKYYSTFDVSSWTVAQNVKFDQDKVLLVPPQTRFQLPLQNGNRFIPKRHEIQAEGLRFPPRMLGLRFNYPPVHTNSGIIFSEGMYGWETFDADLGRWCGKECWFVARTCSHGLQFSLKSPIPDASAQHISWQAWKLPKEIDLKQLDQMRQMQAPWHGDVSFSMPEPHSIALPGDDDSYYLVSLSATKSFIPSELLSGNTDGRTLSFVVLDGSCG